MLQQMVTLYNVYRNIIKMLVGKFSNLWFLSDILSLLKDRKLKGASLLYLKSEVLCQAFISIFA